MKDNAQLCIIFSTITQKLRLRIYDIRNREFTLFRFLPRIVT